MQEGEGEKLVVTEPINITYHESTGHVVASLGIQGVLVGDSSETWRRVSVGEFAPTDFSFFNKARLMFSTTFWLAAVAIAVCLATLVLAAGELLTTWGREGTFRKVIAIPFAIVGIIVAINGFPAFGGDAFSSFSSTDRDYLLVAAGFGSAFLAVIFLPPQRYQLRAYCLAVAGMIAFVFLPTVLWLAGGINFVVAVSASIVVLAIASIALAKHLFGEATL